MFLYAVHRLRNELEQPMVNKPEAVGVCTPRATAIRALDEEAHAMARGSDAEALTSRRGPGHQAGRPGQRPMGVTRAAQA